MDNKLFVPEVQELNLEGKIMFSNICDNDRQAEYLLAIRDVGWAIIKKRCSKSVVLQAFIPFYYDMQDDVREDYLTELVHVYNKIVKNECSPDDLLLELGYYTQYIEECYDDNVTLSAYGNDMVIELFDHHLSGDSGFFTIQQYLDDNQILLLF